MSINVLLLIASSVISTTYGYDEKMCGDVESPRACGLGAITASGIPFNPALPQVAIAAPTTFILKARYIGLRIKDGKCVKVHLVDKMHERWISERGFDITPRAQELITGKPATPYWSGKLTVCDYDEAFNKPVKDLPKKKKKGTKH